jgi:hypothetical protein
MMNEGYRATPEQWEKQKRRVRMQGALLADDAPCLLELLPRVEALEAAYETMRLAALEWGEEVDKVMRWSDQHLQRIEQLEAAENYRQQDQDAELARCDHPAIKPVPVAERLPGPEDCDAEGMCWWWCHHYESWMFHSSQDHYMHWLPHWALPVPTPNES